MRHPRRGRLAFPRLGETRPRGGITLTEVLISMGILTFGLLGVAAIFPVGSYYMQKGDIADRGSAIAQSVMNDVVARGMLDPRKWYVMVPNDASTSSSSLLTPKYKFKVDPSGSTARTYTRPFAAALAEAQALITDQSVLAKQFGGAYLLDPMGVADVESVLYAPGSPGKRYASYVPANSFLVPASVYAAYASKWDPWGKNTTASEDTWPIRRVTFHQPNRSLPALQYHEPLKAPTAEALFSGHDDLALDLPDQADQPAIQNWEVTNIGGVKTPLARQARGDYSWIVTVAPTTSDARNGLASPSSGHTYNVSVVAFYKRALVRTDPVDQTTSMAAGDSLMRQERAVQAKVMSTGLSGGELLLTAYDGKQGSADDGLGTPFTELKAGQWILLCGPHPDSTDASPRFVLNWYRVLSIDGKDTVLDKDGNPSTDPANERERRLVALRGPQWPWQPRSSYSDPNSEVAKLSNWLCVGIFPGAVAVHSKTMSLEGTSPWSVE